MHLSKLRKAGNLPSKMEKLLDQIERGPNKQLNKRKFTNGLVRGNAIDGYFLDMDRAEIKVLCIVKWHT